MARGKAPAPAVATQDGTRAVITLASIPGQKIPTQPRYGPVGWAGIDVAPAWAQIGRYAEAIPTQYPTNLPGVQLRCGVETLDSRLNVPSRSTRPIWQQTQAPTNLPGPQLWGRSSSGQQGGIQGAAQQNAVLANQLAAGGKANIIAAEHLMGSAAY